VIRYDRSFTSPVLVGGGIAVTVLLGFLAYVSESGITYWVLLVVTWFILMNCYSCRVTVDQELVVLCYGIGLFQKSFTRHSVTGFQTSKNEKIGAWIYRPFAETSLVVNFRDRPDISLPAISPKELADTIDISGRR
jgi:hypothetical protein